MLPVGGNCESPKSGVWLRRASNDTRRTFQISVKISRRQSPPGGVSAYRKSTITSHTTPDSSRAIPEMTCCGCHRSSDAIV
jgi:hypothetical protein